MRFYKGLEEQTPNSYQYPPVWKGGRYVGRMGEKGVFTFHLIHFSVVCILSFAYVHFYYKINLKSMKNLFVLIT